MFVMIGFGLFMAPIFGVIVYGVAKLIKMIGKRATATLCLSLPFYFLTILTLMETMTQAIENIVHHTNNNVLQFSTFEIVSFGCLVDCKLIS